MSHGLDAKRLLHVSWQNCEIRVHCLLTHSWSQQAVVYQKILGLSGVIKNTDNHILTAFMKMKKNHSYRFGVAMVLVYYALVSNRTEMVVPLFSSLSTASFP